MHHMRQTRDKDFIVRSEQTLWAQNSKARLWIRLRKHIDHFFAGCFAAGKLVGEAVRAKIFFNIAMVVIIEVQGGRRDMNKVTHTPGDSPFTQAASGANVSQIESLLCPPGRGKAGAVPQRINACEHHFSL